MCVDTFGHIVSPHPTIFLCPVTQSVCLCVLVLIHLCVSHCPCLCVQVVYQPFGCLCSLEQIKSGAGKHINIWHAGAVNLGQAQWKRKLEGSNCANMHLIPFLFREIHFYWYYHLQKGAHGLHEFIFCILQITRNLCCYANLICR